MNPRNKFLIVLGVVFAISLTYYLISTPRGSDLDLIGTVDANQVIVSPQMQGRIAKLLVDEGTQVKQATQGSTTSSVANAQALLESARSQLVQAEATLTRVESDTRRAVELANQGVVSDQERVQAQTNLKAQQAVVQSLQQQVTAAQADLNTAVANIHQAHAAQSTVSSTRAQLLNAEAQLKQAEVRLGYTKIYAPVTGTVSVRAAREGEFLNPGTPIVTIVDFGDTWVRAAIPETQSDHIGLGDSLRVRLPSGTLTSGKVFFKSAEADFATQRDVSRTKRDIRTIVLKVRLNNPKGAYVPGMTADVLVSQAQLRGTSAGASATVKGAQP